MHKVPMKWLKEKDLCPDPLGDYDEWFLYVHSLRLEAEILEYGYYNTYPVTGRWVSWR